MDAKYKAKEIIYCFSYYSTIGRKVSKMQIIGVSWLYASTGDTQT